MNNSGMDAVEDIKAKLSIEEVIGDYLELKRAGRNLKANSPFSNEKTPSFMVSPEKQIWHDFSSNRGGNMFSFVMEMEGVDFRGALELLARKAGVDLSQYNRGPDNSGRKAKLSEALELATKYFQQALVKSPSAQDYLLKKRGFTKNTLTTFRLGYSPDSTDGLVVALKKRGFSEEEIKAAGLGTQRYSGFSDMFRGRIMVPLKDPQGAVIGFTARILIDDPNAPKYFNTPQTLLYDKGRHIFGLSEAKQAIRTSGHVVMVEGNLDVISSHQAGVKQVIATAGTALTDYHLKTLARFSEDIRIAFDQDEAGLRATERAIGMAAIAGIRLSVIDIEDGKDPDELASKNPKAWAAAVDKPVYAMDWLRQRYMKLNDITSASGKKNYTTLMLKVISTLQDPVEQEHYLDALAKDIDASRSAIRSKYSQFKEGAERRYKRPRVEPMQTGPDLHVYQDHLLALLIGYPITRRVLETIDNEPVFASPERQFVFEYVAMHPHDSITEVPDDLQNTADYVKILLLLAEELYATFDANERLREAHDLVRHLQKDYKKSEINKLSAAIRDAEERGDENEVAKLLGSFNSLLKQDKE
jgi:DNA primase